MEAAIAFETYITNNQALILNYAERHRYGEIISTGFVESAVNEIISKRMVKKQQMRWMKKGAVMATYFIRNIFQTKYVLTRGLSFTNA